MTIYDIGIGFGFTLTIIAVGILLYWYDNHKPKTKPRITICVKCKYCVKTRWWHARIKSTRCRTPSDTVWTSFITGKKTYPKFKCSRHNLHGTCPYYKKVWWRR